MESAEEFPGGAIKAPDLADHLGHPGPFVSVYLHTDPDVEKAAQRSEQRWKTLRRELEEMGAPSEALARIEPKVPEAHMRGRVLGAVADGGGALHVEHGDPVRPQDLGRVGAVPYVLPMIRWRQSAPPFLVVLIDRTGADVFAITRGVEESREVAGREKPVHKPHAGGWAMRRYQERAENTWERNAENVAETVQAMARRFDPRRIAVAGDVRAVALLRGSMAAELKPLVVEVSGNRPRDPKDDPIPDEVSDVVADAVRGETEALLERLRQELGEGDLAAEGAEDVVAAVARAQVETLLIEDDLEDDSTVWVGDKPAEIATSPDDLTAIGIAEPTEARRRDAIVTAALATDAGIRVVETGSEIADGIGTLLRWRNGDAAAS
jgi:hypothetical protein